MGYLVFLRKAPPSCGQRLRSSPVFLDSTAERKFLPASEPSAVGYYMMRQVLEMVDQPLPITSMSLTHGSYYQ